MTVENILFVAHRATETLTVVLFSVAIAVFVYGIIKYIASAGDAQKEKEARGYIVYGLIGLFVLVAFWALVTVVTSTFGLEGESETTEYPEPPLITLYNIYG